MADKVTKTLEIKVTTDQAKKEIKALEDNSRKLLNSLHKDFGDNEKITKAFSDARSEMTKLIEAQKVYNEYKQKESELQKAIKFAKSDEQRSALKEGIKEYKSRREKIVKDNPEVKDEEKEAANKKLQGQIIKKATNELKKFERAALQVFNTLGINLKSVFGDVVNELGKMLDPYKGMASYGLGTSLFTNAAAREQAMKYGLSDAQNYALSQTMSMLGMSSDTDLMYMNSAQKEKFNRLMDQYNNWYTKMESTGLLENVQEAQLEFKMLKQEIAYKLLDWFAKHKDQIMTALQVIMKAVEVIANVIIAILNAIPGAKHYSSGVDASVIGSNAITNNVNINNTNNGTALLNNKEELQASFDASNANLVKQIGANLLAYK